MTTCAGRRPPRGSRGTSRGAARAGFTLVELLVVIGIILILIGILVPMVAHVKVAAQTADTEQEISNLSQAIQQYFNDFHGYPGPFSNDDLEVGTSPVPPTPPATGLISMGIYDPKQLVSPYQFPAPLPIPPQWNVTASENLVLGLLGGLRMKDAGQPCFAPAEVGLGPLSLNPADPRRYASYLNSTSGTQTYLWTGWTPNNPSLHYHDQANSDAKDSMIPEFVDRFPVALPLLYMRARVGARGVISDGEINYPATAGSGPAQYQYDLREISPYTNDTSHLGLPDNKSHNLVRKNSPAPQTITFIKPGLPGAPTLDDIAKKGQSGSPDLGAYMCNPNFTPTAPGSAGPPINDIDWDYYAKPRKMDEFILISAGPDGIYGTADDIANFGQVVP